MELSTSNKNKINSYGSSAELSTAGIISNKSEAADSLDIKDTYKSRYRHCNNDGAWENVNFEKDVVENNDLDNIVDLVMKVNEVKMALGLPDKDIASTLRVTRQTLYNYRTQEPSTINAKDHILKRADELYFITKKFNNIFEQSPGPGAKNIIINNVTLLDLLSTDVLNQDRIIKFARKLANKINEDRNISHVKRATDIERKRNLYNLTKHT